MPARDSSLSLAEARQLALRAQGLSGPLAKIDADELVRRLGAIQIDTISVLARSHLLVNWSRLGPRSARAIEAHLWSGAAPATFEYWSHAACILPIEHWPWYAFKRRERRARGRRWHRLADGENSLQATLARLESDGPLTANALGGAKGGGPWWDWTEQKIAVEWLLDIGEVVCVERRGFARVYDLAARAIPAELLGIELDDASCHRLLIDAAGRVLGSASAAELGRHNGLSTAQVRAAVTDSNLVPVQVEGAREPHYAHPEALSHLGEPLRVRTTMLSPFDSMIWDRPRTARLFGFTHRLEAYTPKDKRVHGYYSMPILAGDQIVGRIDPKRDGATLIARHISLDDPRATNAAATALRQAARWVAAEQIVVERVSPAGADKAMREALSRT